LFFFLLVCALILSSVLHSGLKLKYFHQHDLEEEWVKNMEALMCDKYTTCYEGKVGLTAAADTTDTANNNDDNFAAFTNNLFCNTVPTC